MIYWACYTMSQHHAKSMAIPFTGNISVAAKVALGTVCPPFFAIHGADYASTYQVKKGIITKGVDKAGWYGKAGLFFVVSVSCMFVAGYADKSLRNGIDATNLLIAEAVLLGLLFLMIVAEAIRVDHVLSQKEIGELTNSSAMPANEERSTEL